MRPLAAVIDTVICGDALEVMRELPDGCCDAVVTDPPYNVGFGYDTHIDTMDWYDYQEWQLSIFAEAARILKPTGNMLWLNYPEAAARIWAAVCEDVPELTPVEWLTWIYHQHTQGTPFRKATRAWLWFARSDTGYRDTSAMPSQYRNPDDPRIRRRIEDGLVPLAYDWWACEQVKNVCLEKTDHPCQIPEAMVKVLVEMTCPTNGTVLDPFLGSGTTAVACIETGRHFIGVELSEAYCDIARRRIANAQRPLEVLA